MTNEDTRYLRLSQHPCFGIAPCGTRGRVHLPVAPRCNLQCAFCDRRYDCANESRPGVTSRIMAPEEAVRHAVKVFNTVSQIKVVGIAGPGDPLANEETFETCRLLRRALPDALLCLSTNGLALENRFSELLDCRPDTLTVTVNAVTQPVAERLYSCVMWNGQVLSREEGAARVLLQQQRGLSLLASAGIPFKVNTVLIPGINDGEITDIAAMAKEYRAEVMNLVPLIPCGSLSEAKAPTKEELEAARTAAAPMVRQFTGCRQCRADACGIV